MLFKDFMSSGIDGPDNYMGEDLSRYDDWLVAGSRSRDSDALTQSNYDCALDRLGGECDGVEVLNFGHWACGWFEVIIVNPVYGNKATTALAIERELQEYPCLDEEDLSEKERETALEGIEHVMSMFLEEELQDAAEGYYDISPCERNDGGYDTESIAEYVVEYYFDHIYVDNCIHTLAPDSSRAWDVVRRIDELDADLAEYSRQVPLYSEKAAADAKELRDELNETLKSILLKRIAHG